jgi:hypothetical protein
VFNIAAVKTFATMIVEIYHHKVTVATNVYHIASFAPELHIASDDHCITYL